jgi:hypothetical protein
MVKGESSMTEEEEFEFRARREKERAQPKEPTFGEKAGALGYGAVTGLAGGLGELEKFGAYEVPEMLGFREKGERDQFAGRETIFPTIAETEKVLKKVGIEKPREEVGGYQTAGEILGGFGTSLPGLVKGGVKALVGSTSRAGEESAKALEKLGFKLSPSQVRQAGPSGERGAKGFAEYNQRLANNLASQGTGKGTDFITDKFIAERLSDLGEQFNKVYRGKTFNIDGEARNAVSQILAEENAAIGPSGTSAVKDAAQDIIKNFEKLASRPGAKADTFGIEGEGLQKLRNALTERARSSSRTNAHEIYELVDVIDASIAKNHPEAAAKLVEIRPKYRNSIILEDLYRSGGIDRGDISLERLGNLIKKERSSVRRTGQDIDVLGKLGKDNRLRAIWETEGKAPTEATQALKEGLGTDVMRFAGTPLRTRPARVVQKMVGGEPGTRRVLGPGMATAPQAVAAGTATRPLQTEE